MRYHEISGGFRLAVNHEEQKILDMASETKLLKSALDERGQEVARLMVSRGLLDRKRDGESVYFAPSTTKDMWRY